MGNASSLFFRSNDPEAQTLIRRISPSSEQFEQQRARWNELADHLIEDLRGRSGCAIRTWLQGSYKFGTQIRPPNKYEEFDIDLGIYFCWVGQADNGEHSAADLKGFTQASLQQFAAAAEGILKVEHPPKTRCSRIRYTGNFHIDVPAYHLEPNLDERTLAAAEGWEISDPKAIYTWFKGKFDDSERAVARRLIKYLKCWAALKWDLADGRPSSILLTVLTADAVGRLSDEQTAADDDALKATLGQISKRLRQGSFIRNPVNPSENLRRLDEKQWATFVSALDEFYGISQDASVAGTQLEAADLWAKAFKHFFPMPEPSDIPASETVAKDYLPAVINLPDVAVTAISRTNKHVRFEDVNRIGPIPKDCDLTFQIKEPWKLLPGTIVNWVVRNEGAEAENNNDLGHNASTGYKTVETSAYVGTHYMDCILYQSGRAIAVRRIPVSVAGVYAPPRNPIRKPTYTRLAGRR